MVGIKKGQQWGGDWTMKKLDAFAKYVNAYLTIMNNFRDQYQWTLIYFDGFAGSGSSQYSPEQDKEDSNLILQKLEEENLYDPIQSDVYKGAAERVLDIEQKGFDYYYFVEKNSNSCKALEDRLSPYSSRYKIEFRCDDANNVLEKMAKYLHSEDGKKSRALVLLDPFGMQVKWESIERLRGTHTDIWILVPTGVIINRLLDKKGKLTNIKKLQDCFGMPEDEIRSYFYAEEQEMTLFGEEESRIEKIKKPIKKIADLYVKRLGTIFPHVTSQPLVLYNNKNVPIYHFVFASQNETAKKIAQEIIGKR